MTRRSLFFSSSFAERNLENTDIALNVFLYIKILSHNVLNTIFYLLQDSLQEWKVRHKRLKSRSNLNWSVSFERNCTWTNWRDTWIYKSTFVHNFDNVTIIPLSLTNVSLWSNNRWSHAHVTAIVKLCLFLSSSERAHAILTYNRFPSHWPPIFRIRILHLLCIRVSRAHRLVARCVREGASAAREKSLSRRPFSLRAHETPRPIRNRVHIEDVAIAAPVCHRRIGGDTIMRARRLCSPSRFRIVRSFVR